MHPFLDVSKLTDEQIMEKLGKAYTHMNSQISLGHTPTVVSIKEVINSLEQETRSRMMRSQHEEFKKKYPESNTTIELGKLDN